MNVTLVTMFECSRCGELHDEAYEARECCPKDVDEVTLYNCGNCGTNWDELDHARQCCWDGETELEPYIPTPAELERAGQQRLPL